MLTENCFKNSDVKFFLERGVGGGGIVLKCYCISIRRPLEEFEYVSNYLIALNSGLSLRPGGGEFPRLK